MINANILKYKTSYIMGLVDAWAGIKFHKENEDIQSGIKNWAALKSRETPTQQASEELKRAQQKCHVLNKVAMTGFGLLFMETVKKRIEAKLLEEKSLKRIDAVKEAALRLKLNFSDAAFAQAPSIRISEMTRPLVDLVVEYKKIRSFVPIETVKNDSKCKAIEEVIEKFVMEFVDAIDTRFLTELQSLLEDVVEKGFSKPNCKAFAVRAQHIAKVQTSISYDSYIIAEQ